MAGTDLKNKKEEKLTNKLKPHFSLRNGSNLVSALYVLLGMLVIQAVITAVNAGTVENLLPTMVLSWMNVLRNNAYAGIIAIGMCYIIISGGIDISVGSTLCAVGAFLMYLIDPATGLLAQFGILGAKAYVIAIAAALVFGLLLGEINGVLISKFNVPPFIVTLGTMKIFRSVTQQLTQQFNPTVPEGFKQIVSYKIGGQVILPIIYWLILVVVLTFVFKKTVFGRNVVATGSNERAAMYSGINTKSVKRRVYALTGVLCAVAAIIYVARIGSMDFSSAGSGYEMDAIAAVVVGGTAMTGGKGDVLGSFIGMIIISLMNNILNSIGVPTFLCDAVRGAIIIFAVLAQSQAYMRKKSGRKMLKINDK